MHKIIIIINFVCLGEERWGRSPPRVKDSNLFLVRHMCPAKKVYESIGM